VIFDVRATFEVALQTDIHLVLIDLDQGASVTNDADAVVAWLAANLEGGIGKRKVYTGTPMDALMSSRLMPVLLPDLHLVAKASRPPWLGCSTSNPEWRT